MDAKHTALPWVQNHDDVLSSQDPADVVARCGWPSYESVPNAEFIVRACNSHDGLVAALHAIVWEVSGPGKPFSADSWIPDHMRTAAVNALAEASK